MIRIEYITKNYITNFTVSGHALYDEYGSDIVCASVSTAVIFAFNLAVKFDNTIKVYEDDANLKIEINKYNDNVEIVLNILVDTLSQLQEQYKENIKIIRR